MKNIRLQRGQLLVAGIVLIVVIALMITALGFLYVSGERSATMHGQSDQAYFAARSGTEYVRRLYFTGTACGAGLNTTQAVGSGSFTTSGATLRNVSSASVAVGGVTAAATTIPVNSTAGYAPFGRIVIDSEEMYYGAISGNTFINVRRGTSGTTPVAHIAARVAWQYLCNVISVGTVGTATRRLQVNMPPQSYKQGVFAKRTTTGSQSISGVGFQPKAVIFFWTRQTAATQSAGASAGMGFATAAANVYGAAVGSRDNRSNSSNGRRHSAINPIIFMNETVSPPVMVAQAALTSLDADGFTLNWTTTDATAHLVNYIALGGDITNALAGNFNMANATGVQAIAGLGFSPNFVLFIHEAEGAVDTNATDSQFGIGFAESSAGRGASVYHGEDNVGSNIRPRWQQLTNRAVAFLTHATPPAAGGQADFVSMDANGFTINVTATTGATTWSVGYLALRGPRFDTGTVTQPGATGTQAISGLGFKPQGLVMASHDLVTGVTVAAGRTSIGAAGGRTIANQNIWFQENGNSVSTSATDMYNDASNIISMGLNTANANVAQARLQSLDADGFTLNWSAADATAREILYWAIGRDYADVEEVYP